MSYVLTLDFETKDPSISQGRGAGWPFKDFVIIGAAYQIDSEAPVFTVDMEEVEAVVRGSKALVMHNAQYDIGVLHRLGIDYSRKTIVDTMILAKLYDNTMQSYSLDSLGSWLLGVGKDYGALEEAAKEHGIKKYMSHLDVLFGSHPELVAQYAKQDVNLTYKLSQWLKEELYEEALALIPMYSDLIKALVLWRSRGIKIDLEQAERSDAALQALHDQYLEEFYTYCPGVNIESTKQLAEAFKGLGLVPGVSAKGGDSVDSKWRSTQSHPAVVALESAKKYNKLRREFVEGIVDRTEDGRLYPEMNILGASETGRFSSCVPMTTLALTKRGWKSYDELIVGEEILAYDMETDTQRWTPLLAKRKFIGQEVGIIGNDRTYFTCTANHKWINDNGIYKDRVYRSFKQADKFANHHLIKVNSAYEGGGGVNLSLDEHKYGTDWVSKVVNMTIEELQCFVTGFLLADGHHQPPTKHGVKYSWQFTQVEGDILDALHLAAYLLHDKRVSKSSHGARVKNTHRPTYRVNLTSSARVVTSNVWKATDISDVWCPTTAYGTWVMKEGDRITITCNSNPNIQQIPKRDKLATELVRSLIVADEGKTLYSLDFSSQEPRLQVHYAYLADCRGASEVRSAYLKNPNLDLHQQVANMAGIDRKQAKTINLGISYGMGPPKLADALKIDRGEARDLLSRYSRMAPYLEGLNRAVKKSGTRKGYITTLLGRRLKMDYDAPYKALNKLIQGGAADQTTMAMVQAYREGLEVMFAVHDELVLQASNPADAERLKVIMETSTDLTVPSVTDIMGGPTWGTLTSHSS